MPAEAASAAEREAALAAADARGREARAAAVNAAALASLPVGGLRDYKIRLRIYGPEPDDETLPETHTCTREVRVARFGPEPLADLLLRLSLLLQ